MTAIHLQPYGYRRRQRYQRHTVLDWLSEASRRVLVTLREWHRRSRERGELAGLDERMLRDIGLSRPEAEFLANKPFWKE